MDRSSPKGCSMWYFGSQFANALSLSGILDLGQLKLVNCIQILDHVPDEKE